MESVRLPSTLKKIERRAFFRCKNLKGLTFPTGLEKIGLYAFSESGLESAEFPASLRTIAQGTFACCKSLRTAKFAEGLETLGTDERPENGNHWYGVFQGSALESVTLPSTLRRIEDLAFKKCKNLRSVTLPEDLKYIGYSCFRGTGIVEITLPGALQEVGENTFADCASLKIVWMEDGCKINAKKLVGNDVEVRRK